MAPHRGIELMGAYIPAIVWLAGMAICAWIAHRRGVRATLFWRLFVVFFGPLAIPFMFLIKPDPEGDCTR